MNFQELPDEMIEEVMGFLSGPELLTLACVNKQCLKISNSNNRVWKTLCTSDWTNLTGVEPFYEEDEAIDWKSIYQERQIGFNQWKSSLKVRKWLITDYLKLMWFFFVNPKNQPLYLPKKESQSFIQNTITSGSILISFLVFLPLIFLALIYRWYSLIFLPYFLIMFFVGLFIDQINLSDFQGIVVFTSYLALSIISLILSYTNDLLMIFCLLFTLSIILSLAHSMRHMIITSENIDDIFQSTTSNMLIVSVLVGSLIGIAGVRIFAIILVIVLALLTGEVPDVIFSLIGWKGFIMIIGLVICTFLYFIGKNSLGENFIKREQMQMWISRGLFVFIFLCNLILITRYTMIQHFGYQRLYFQDFNWGSSSNTTSIE